jgi:hypothetical protein
MAGNQSRLNGKKGGRPKGRCSERTLAKREVRRLLIERVEQESEELLNALFNLAKGHKIQRESEIYKVSPNPKVLQWIFNQAIGRADVYAAKDGEEGTLRIVIEHPDSKSKEMIK